MDKRERKKLERIRSLEEKLVYATPERAAALAARLVRLKGKLFKDQ